MQLPHTSNQTILCCSTSFTFEWIYPSLGAKPSSAWTHSKVELVSDLSTTQPRSQNNLLEIFFSNVRAGSKSASVSDSDVSLEAHHDGAVNGDHHGDLKVFIYSHCWSSKGWMQWVGPTKSGLTRLETKKIG